MLEKHKDDVLKRLDAFLAFIAENEIDILCRIAHEFMHNEKTGKMYTYYEFLANVLKIKNPMTKKSTKLAMGSLNFRENPIRGVRAYTRLQNVLQPTVTGVMKRKCQSIYRTMRTLVSASSDCFGAAKNDKLLRDQTRFHFLQLDGSWFRPHEKNEGKVSYDSNSSIVVIRNVLVADHFVSRFAERIHPESNATTYKDKEKLLAEFLLDGKEWYNREKHYMVIVHKETNTLIEIFNVEGFGCIYFFGFGYYQPMAVPGRPGNEVALTALMLTCMAEENLEDWKRDELYSFGLTSDNWLETNNEKSFEQNLFDKGWLAAPALRLWNFGTPKGR
jgi:hypothetical protein